MNVIQNDDSLADCSEMIKNVPRYVVQRDGFVKHIVCLGNYQPGGQPFVHILIIVVKLSGSLGLILSDNLEQFSHKYCEHCFLFACTVYKQGFYLIVKGKKRFLKFFIEYFKHISRCPGVNSSNAVISGLRTG